MRVISAEDFVPVETLQTGELISRATAWTTVTIAGITLMLHSDDAELCAAFARRFRAHSSEAAPDVHYYVVRDAGRYLFFGDGCETLCWPHCDLSLAALVFLADPAAISCIIHAGNGLTSYHAAAVEFGGAAAAIVADSGGGKTTTLLACARAGMRVYSDERLLVRDGTVHQFLRTCNVRDDGMQRLLRDDSHDVLAQALHHTAAGDLSVLDVFGGQIAAPPAPLRAVFVIVKDHAPRAIATPISPYAALPAFQRWAYDKSARLTRAARAVELLSSVACYRLSLGTPRETAECIRELLRRQ